jgi:1,2-beta-oligoglucan phosphorylase
MENGAVAEGEVHAVTLDIGNRQTFDRIEYSNTAGLRLGLYNNGGSADLLLDELMINQLEGRPLQGGLDQVWLRVYSNAHIQSHPLSGTAAACALHKNGAVWRQSVGQIEASMQLLLHPRLPVLLRICRAHNHGTDAVTLDWLAGQDLGLADPGMLKNNEAYVCQYLDHRIVEHPAAGKVVLSRNNLHAAHPFAVNCCLQGAQAASTDGYQFFGTDYKLSGTPAALHAPTLENCVRQYEFAYAALQSRTVNLRAGQGGTAVFALYVLKEHPEVSSTDDLVLLDELLGADLPEPGELLANGAANAFFARAPLLAADTLQEAELKRLFEGAWRHVEYSRSRELLSFFYGDDAHAALPAKERVVERQHGTILRSGQGAALADNAMSATCYGYGAFGTQLALGNTAFGRFSSVMRNSLNIERSSGIRLFANIAGQWTQLGFPSVFAMERDRVRWIYRTNEFCLEIAARATSDTLEYRAAALVGALPALRLTWEVCGEPNEFDGAPRVEWKADRKLLTLRPVCGSLLERKFPESCLLARIDAVECAVGGAERLDGRNEPYVVMDFPAGEFTLTLTGHYDGRVAAMARFGRTAAPDWASLLAHFQLTSESPVAAKLSDTVKWFAHHAMIHYAAPRGMEQYGTAAWGTRDVCQGALEFLLALGHDRAVADMLREVFAHQYQDTGTWPQWFMFDEFREVQGTESHGDIIFWPIKALCDYIEQTGDSRILEHQLCYTDPHSMAFTTHKEPLREHLNKAVAYIRNSCIPGTALPSYGNGDWDDSLQPADPAMKTHMASGWTVGLALQTLGALARIWAMAGFTRDAQELDAFLTRMQSDFRTHVVRDGVAAGFVLFDGDTSAPLLHPADEQTGIHYRLLPINRAIIAELFTPQEMASHLELVHRHLKFPDGVRLMDRSPQYRGGKSVHFQRAETAAHFGREIGLLYVHANIRYCEALAKAGRADELLEMLQVISPVATADVVPNALPRQANLYFTSSDAQVYDRYEAARRLGELKTGKVGTLGGWRLYSSGPGIYIGLVISRVFGIRRSYGRVVFDPVLSLSLNGAVLSLDWYGKRVRWVYHVAGQAFGPDRIVVNGAPLVDCQRVPQAYRQGGLSIDATHFNTLLNRDENTVDIYL